MKIIVNDYDTKDIIKIIRQWAELTQKEFAKTINKSTRVIESYEQGESDYNIKTLMKIAKEHNLIITIEKK